MVPTEQPFTALLNFLLVFMLISFLLREQLC